MHAAQCTEHLIMDVSEVYQPLPKHCAEGVLRGFLKFQPQLMQLSLPDVRSIHSAHCSRNYTRIGCSIQLARILTSQCPVEMAAHHSLCKPLA